MAAKRVTSSSIDWVAFVARVPKNQTVEFNTFKGKCDSYLRRVASLPETLPKIHWDQYKTRIVVPGMLEDFQKQYESLQIPYPADNFTAKINETEKKVMTGVEKYCQESDAKIENFKKELVRFENMIPVTEMMLEEFVEEFPDQSINWQKPTLWPHVPEIQPGYVPPEGVQESSH